MTEIEERIAFFTDGAGESLARRINEAPITPPPVPRPSRWEPPTDPRDDLIRAYAELQRSTRKRKPRWRKR